MAENTVSIRIPAILKSKTVWGTLLAIGGYLIGQPHIGATEIMTAVGTILAAIGVKDGQTKTQIAASTGQPTP